MNGMRAIALGVLLCAAVSCGKKAPEASPAPTPAAETGPKGPPPPRISGNVAGLDASKDLSADLKALIERTIEAMHKDPARFGEIVASFALPDPEGWSKATFGDGVAVSRVASASSKFEEEMKWQIERLVADKRTSIDVVRVVKADDAHVTDLQKEWLGRMKSPCALYTVNFHGLDGDPGAALRSWVYVGGGFRFLGEMK